MHLSIHEMTDCCLKALHSTCMRGTRLARATPPVGFSFPCPYFVTHSSDNANAALSDDAFLSATCYIAIWLSWRNAAEAESRLSRLAVRRWAFISRYPFAKSETQHPPFHNFMHELLIFQSLVQYCFPQRSISDEDSLDFRIVAKRLCACVHPPAGRKLRVSNSWAWVCMAGDEKIFVTCT